MEKVNWKREGYKVGDKIFVVSTQYDFNTGKFEYTNKYMHCEITYVGIKILKVKSNKDEKMVFNRRKCRSSLLGHGYAAFKDEQEFEIYKTREKIKEKLQIELTEKIKHLPLETLYQINEVIKKDNTI